MQKKSFKKNRLEEAIKESLAQILITQSNDEAFVAVTITRVTLSKDLRKATVLYTAFAGEQGKLELKLNRAKGFLRTCLAKAIKTKYIPDLEFIWDEYEKNI